jgi:hypothetical protein
MTKTVHVIGNGDNATRYDPKSKGTKITCNLPPFPVPDATATCLVDFKMVRAMHEGSVGVPGDWILGFRPMKYLEMNPDLRIKWMHNIRDSYLILPDYAPSYTAFNCGHMAVHYSANKLKGKEIHMYGFDSIFDLNLRSCTDFYLNSDRTETNSFRLSDSWRPIWQSLFKEFSDTKFVLHHNHDGIKFSVPENVEIYTK